MKTSTRLVVGAFLALQAAMSSAAILTFNINQTFSQGGLGDLPATSISLNGAGQFIVDPGFSGDYFDFQFPGTGTFSTIATQIDGYYFLDSYAAGESIGPGNFGDDISIVDDWDTILVNGQTAGVWGSSHNGYLGFRADNGSFGWIEYAFTRSGPTSTMALLGGAYNDVANAEIVAGGGSVPEPATLALLGLGLAGMGLARKKKSS